MNSEAESLWRDHLALDQETCVHIIGYATQL